MLRLGAGCAAVAVNFACFFAAVFFFKSGLFPCDLGNGKDLEPLMTAIEWALGFGLAPTLHFFTGFALASRLGSPRRIALATCLPLLLLITVSMPLLTAKRMGVQDYLGMREIVYYAYYGCSMLPTLVFQGWAWSLLRRRREEVMQGVLAS